MVNTYDEEQYFSQESGKDLKPVIDLNQRTVNKLEIHVKALPKGKYSIHLDNISMPLPVDVTTDAGTQRLMVDSKGIKVDSKTVPVIDKDSYYLKKLIIE